MIELNYEMVEFNDFNCRLTFLVYGGRSMRDHKDNIIEDGFEPLYHFGRKVECSHLRVS